MAKKRELEKRIQELERRMYELEARPIVLQPVVAPSVPVIAPNTSPPPSPFWSITCSSDGVWSSTEGSIEYSS